jgi:hypothetical protein
MPDKKLADYRQRLATRRKQYHFVVGRIHRLKAAIAKRQKALKAAKGTPGERAVAFLLHRAGWHESPAGSNDAPFLAHWRTKLKMGWMLGSPWCGFACMAAWLYGAGKHLPADTVSTVAILSRARRGDGFTAVPASKAKPGDLVVFNFPGGAPAEHVGLARGPAKGGVIPTVEGNTSPGSGGSQANGGGIYVRTRPVGLIAVVARPK